MKKIAMIGTLLLISIFSITYVWASVEENCNVSLQTDKTELSRTREQVKITISLDSYDGDGTLGYEGKLEYDTNIFESATITSLNDWETANYETTTGMFLSTTTSAKAGTQVAQITLDLKENVTAISTQVKITGLTFSDGDTQKTFEETFDYSFPYNIQKPLSHLHKQLLNIAPVLPPESCIHLIQPADNRARKTWHCHHRCPSPY